MDESRPIFIQITEQIENDIIEGTLAEGAQIPSINEFATFHRINPATALRGVNRLVDDAIVEKRRGIGMFVTSGARDRLVERRRAEFAATYIRPLIVEAEKLGLDIDQLAALIRSERIES
ncbi:DNA-binding transcriptional regulator YhcF (GntR family) [Agromyces terreus]|uniref:DNA-binding transcriptional regulator YhcF (GntR family) n=1 Tax=Agromyces terreus TaxID=424795 RepID=A0A9X2H741_9MICO|nr:GntR family transcriptional regulator [Agromyces terreus]MCP2370619.1 DNA-binding transcriptional regulator YhcF (GntR family) [Agromyces terreus]